MIKKNKDTNELTNEIMNTSDIKKYISKYEDSFIEKQFFEYMIDIINKKELDYKDIIEKSNMNRSYFYHLLSGIRKPSRNKVIQLAFGLHVSLDELQMLLKVAGMNVLYSKMKRDAIIIYAISNHMSIIETDILLENEGEAIICQ